MHVPRLDDLPPPPPGKRGWPWTEQSLVVNNDGLSAQSLPRISMVTPSYNQGIHLEETIRSVLLQGYPNLEYVVIDGGSSDESVDVIRRYERFITSWVSESDNGQYEAIQKGIDRCTGDVFNWINSDDLLCKNALAAVAAAWLQAPGKTIAGPTISFSADGAEHVVTPNAITRRNLIRYFDAGRNDFYWHQPGIFLDLAAVREVGGIRTEYRYISDRLLLIHLSAKRDVQYITSPLARFRLHDASKTVAEGYHRFRLELIDALSKMPEVRDYISPREFRREHARAHLLFAGSEVRSGRYAATGKCLLNALRVSVPMTIGLVFERVFKGPQDVKRGGSMGRP